MTERRGMIKTGGRGRNAPRDKDGLPTWKNSRDIWRAVCDGNGLRLVMLSCGKENCSRCNGKHTKNRLNYQQENIVRRQRGKAEIKNTDQKPLHGPYWYLLRYRGRFAKQWLIGRRIFAKKLQAHSDKALVVVGVLRGLGLRLPPEDFEWEPKGWNAADRKNIGGVEIPFSAK